MDLDFSNPNLIFLIVAIPFLIVVGIWDYREWKKKKELERLKQLEDGKQDKDKAN